MCAKIFRFPVTISSYVPRPKTGCALRSAMNRRIHRSSEVKAQLPLDVDRLEAGHGVHERRQVELREVGA